MERLCNKGFIQLFDIESILVTRNNIIEFSEDNQRIVYMKNYESVHIIPPLHRSTISFIGMLPRERYLAVKKDKNKFYALDKNNRISTWNSMTGKLESIKKIAADFSNYQIFGYNYTKDASKIDYTYIREWNQPRTLIVC